MKEKIEKYIQTRDRAAKWLVSQQDESGEIAGSEEGAFYYRLLWAWTVFGNTEAANKLLGWIRKNAWQDGNLIGKYTVGALSKHYTYILSNVVIGAHLMQNFDIVFSGLRTLRKFKDNWSGGFADGTVNLEPQSWHENWTSAQVGMAFLMAGDISTAKDVGEFLKYMWNIQPELPEKLYFVYDSTKKNIVTESDAPSSNYVIIADQPRQWFWGPGLVSAFLGMLYLATKNHSYLEYGMKYQDFVQSCTPRQFEGIEVCKTGWGASVMYQITKANRYCDWAIAVGDYFVRTQKSDGRWVDDRFDPSTLGQDIAITDQQALWLNAIIASLSSNNQELI